MRLWSVRAASMTVRLCIVTAFATASVAAQPAAHRAGDIVIEASQATTLDGVRIDYETGTLFVPENRAAAGSRIIGIGFARIRAKHPTGAPPVFVLPGGPGRSYIGALTDTGAASRTLLAELVRYADASDVVIVDQRGWSTRGEVLELAVPEKPLGEPRSREAEAAEMATLARRAVVANPDKDLAGYTIIQCAEDVNDLRLALHYPRISLSGQSFGSQWSLAVMRLHPGIVARAVLSGTEPLDNSFDMPSQILASLQRVAWEAEQDPKLQPYLPNGGLMAAIRMVEERLRSRTIKVTLPNSKGKITLGVGDFQASLLRSPATWPAFILSVYHGHYAAFASETAQRRANIEGPVRLIEPLIDSSLGASPERYHLLTTDPAIDLLGTWDFDALAASAEAWPTPPVGDDFRRPVLNQVPIIFIHGDWDIATPIDNMLGLLPYFPNARSVVVHRGTHRSRDPLFAQRPDVAAAVVAFLRSGETDDVPAEVTLQAQVFELPAFPAPA
jgi:pimeloyl-ACP methyl ester carboxylesterase